MITERRASLPNCKTRLESPRSIRGFLNFLARIRAAFVLLSLLLANVLLVAGQIAVTTYHYDNNRTGWNSQEAKLTPANVSSSAFGLLTTVFLDDQVDAQPLVVPGILITAGKNQGKHDVVYVATDGNSVYAIDTHNGTVLLKKNFGKPVPSPLGCNNNGPNVGIHSTPVIDLESKTLYVIVYNNDSTGPTYRIHALDLGNLTDKVVPQVIAASHRLADGSELKFNATYQRQRPGLLLANGNIYAGFGSFCDFAPNLSRGWLLGWSAGSLTPLRANQLMDLQGSTFFDFFLSAIWMSGYGPATDDAGNVLFVTGNSSPVGNSYDGVTNIQESVVKVSPDLITVLDLFTPSNEAWLDYTDGDFGSGGVLVLPDQPGPVPHLAVAAGKAGTMFLMNADDLGGFDNKKNHVLGTYSVGPCWCGQSYFVDPRDGAARVVSSGGHSAKVWKLETSTRPALTLLTSSPAVPGGQNPGFFTTISSNGTANPIIWALSHPLSPIKTTVNLYAFNPLSGGKTMQQLFKGTAGLWPSFFGNSNLVPVVANGEVFVASYMRLQIFGLKGKGRK
jgi:hypothetical protein